MDTHIESEYVNVQRNKNESQNEYVEMAEKSLGQLDDTNNYYSTTHIGKISKEPKDKDQVYQAILKPEAPRRCSYGRIILITALVFGVVLMFVLGYIIGHFTSKDKKTTKKEETEIDSMISHDISDNWLLCDMQAYSYGFDDPDRKRSHILVNGVEHPSQKGRGIHVIRLDPSDCSVKDIGKFDTYGNESHAAAFSTFVTGTESGVVIVIITDDAYTSHLTALEINLLRAMGSPAMDYEHRSSLIIVSFKRTDDEYAMLGSVYSKRYQGPSVLHSLILTNGTYTKYLKYTSTSIIDT